MKNNTSIIVSLLGGIALGATVTCLLKSKNCKIGRGDIHKKIMEEIEQLKKFIAEHHSEEICSCDDPACNCNKD